MYKIIPLVMLCFCLLVNGRDRKLSFDRITSEDGLLDNYTTCIKQDSKGWIWIGTGTGIVRFDGIRFKRYGVYHKDSLIKEDLITRCFFESSDSSLYASFEEFGIAKFNFRMDRFERLIIGDSLIFADISVKDVAEDHDGNLWLATKNGIFQLNLHHPSIRSFVHVPNHPQSLSHNYVRKVLIDKQSNLWIATQKGLDMFNPEKETFIHYGDINASLGDEILDIYIDSNQRKWIGTSSHGLWIIDNHHIKRFEKIQPFSRSNKVNTIFQDNRSDFWIGTRGGLFLYNDSSQSISFFENNPVDETSLVHNSVIDITQDIKGDMWIATRGGISHLVKEKQVFETFKARTNDSHYLNNSEIYSIWEDHSGHIWLGTENGGVNILDPQKGTFRYLTQSNSQLSNNCIKAIASSGNGKIYIGTFQGGLMVYDEKTGQMTCYPHLDNTLGTLSDNMIWDICIDKKGRIWIGTTSGLDRFDPSCGSFIHYPEFDDLVNGVSWIDVDHENDLWLGAQKTLVFRPDSGIIASFDEAGRSMFTDHKGNHWLMTNNRGILLMDKHQGVVKSLNKKNGIASNLTYCMLEDASGKLWISTSNGLSCFHPETGVFKNYYQSDGLQGNQFHYGAAFKSKDGRLMFGGVNGLTIFNPQEITDNQYIPPVYLTEFKIFNQPVTINDAHAILKESLLTTRVIEIPYKFNVLTFDFAALNYTNSSQNKYRYILEGFDKNWIETQENRSATYTNLKPGEYWFRVIAANNNGYWNENGTAVKLIILPPFYKQWWFIALTIALILFTLLGVLIWIFKRRELQKLLEFERIKARKLHELDLFKLKLFTNLSHEIKTPLTLIISPVKQLLKQTSLSQEMKDQLHLMEKNASQLMELVTQLLDYRKLQDGKLKVEFRRGDIVLFCKNCFEAFGSLMKERNIQHHMTSMPSEIVCYFDADKIRTILNNLISNAIKYNKPNGSVSVSITREDHGCVDSTQWVKIAIKDTGLGIRHSDRDGIFDRYFSNAGGEVLASSGIGLAYVKELIELLDGKISVESQFNNGSVFTVQIPFRDKPDTSLPWQESNSDVPDQFNEKPTNQKILLVVDDNADIRNFIRMCFKKQFKVIEAHNGQTGIIMAQKIIPDVIISDVMMPGIDGKELCRIIKEDERTSHVPVLLLSALSSQDSIKKGLEKGADDYITKPFDVEVLQTKVRNLLVLRDTFQHKYSGMISLPGTKPSLVTPDERFLEKVIRVTETHMDNPHLDIELFSQEMGISRMQLYRKLAALTHMTVKEFVNDIRLMRAAQLLSEKKLNISETAWSVGFNDLSYFGKCFKKKFGMNPSEYVVFLNQKK